MSSHWTTEGEYLSCGVPLPINDLISLTYSWMHFASSDVFEKTVEEIISVYKKENTVHNLDINNLFVREYTPHVSLNLLHSLVDIGKQIFKDARPRNELEAKIIDDFVRSKTRVISSKQL